MVTLCSGLIVARRGVLPRQHGCSSWDETWTSWTGFTDRRSMTCRKPGLNLATTDFWSWSASLTLIKFYVPPKVLRNLFINNTACLFGTSLCYMFSVSVSYFFFPDWFSDLMWSFFSCPCHTEPIVSVPIDSAICKKTFQLRRDHFSLCPPSSFFFPLLICLLCEPLGTWWTGMQPPSQMSVIILQHQAVMVSVEL